MLFQKCLVLDLVGKEKEKERESKGESERDVEKRSTYRVSLHFCPVLYRLHYEFLVIRVL